MGAGEQMRFGVDGGVEVSALLSMPAKARRLLVLAHGAGAGMHHPFMEMLAGACGGAGAGWFPAPLSRSAETGGRTRLPAPLSRAGQVPERLAAARAAGVPH